MNDPLLPIDPLLNKSTNTMYPPPVAAASPEPAKRKSIPMRKKHPALSARILAAGLSTTALIGLTSGYTMAQRQPATQPVVQEPTVINAAMTISGTASGTTSTNKAAPLAPPVATDQTRVIQVPVPNAASAATPGVTSAPAYQPAQTQQKSSGSR